MCGRYTLTQTEPELLKSVFNLVTAPDDLTPNYNIAPTQRVTVIAHDAEGYNTMGWMRWGLVPGWAKSIDFVDKPLINARSETADEKPSFKRAFRRRRCLIPADGFYEWQKRENSPNIPVYICRADGQPFAFAGLWDRWQNPRTGEALLSCSILTTTANDFLSDIHHRMPIILAPEFYALWLDREMDDIAQLKDVLRTEDDAPLDYWDVSKRVNGAGNNDEGLIARPLT